MLLFSYIVFALLLAYVAFRPYKQPFVISRWGTPLAYWYAFEPAILKKRSVQLYKRNERFVTHDTSYSVSFRVITGGMVL